MPLDLAKEIGKHLQETCQNSEHAKQTKSHEVQSVIKHMIKQKAQCNQNNAVSHEEAITIHAQREIHKIQNIQQQHEQMKHIEQQHMVQRHISRGIEL